jgi:hypothetical protein
MSKDLYITKRLNIAAFLYASGLEFVDADNITGEFFFKFTPRAEAEELVDSYYAGTASVDPRDLFSRLHDLKDLIFSGEKEEA